MSLYRVTCIRISNVQLMYLQRGSIQIERFNVHDCKYHAPFRAHAGAITYFHEFEVQRIGHAREHVNSDSTDSFRIIEFHETEQLSILVQ